MAGAHTSILLIRHATPVRPGTPGLHDNDRPLTAQGFADAKMMAEQHSASRIDAIYSSPYCRAFQTVEPLATWRGISIEVIEDLRERHLIAPGTPEHEWRPQLERSWKDFDYAPSGGETGRIAQRRVMRVLEEVRSRHPSGMIALASHGNLIALALNAMDSRRGFDFWAAMPMPAVYELEWRDAGWRILSNQSV
jgi:2,3-bisphosphoglycerate-dependent phosphoglycerate mutase